MNREYPANTVFVQVQSERQVDLLSNAGAAVSRVAPFHLDNGIDDFFGRAYWAWIASAVWGIQLSVLPFLHSSVKPEQGRWLDNNG
jgi:hypothetical protein